MVRMLQRRSRYGYFQVVSIWGRDRPARWKVGTMPREQEMKVASGWVIFVFLLITLIAAVAAIIAALFAKRMGGTVYLAPTIAAVVWVAIDIRLMIGLFLVNPNEARVIQLFGKHIGDFGKSASRDSGPTGGSRGRGYRIQDQPSCICA